MKSTRRCRRCDATLSRESLYCTSCGTLQVQPALWSWSGPIPPRPAGWFPDPVRDRWYRYWNGDTWTDAVFPFPAQPSAVVSWVPLPIERDRDLPSPFGGALRRGSIGLIFSGFFAALGLSGLVEALWVAIGRPGGTLTLLVVSEIGLWAGFVATCLLISTRFGSGSVRRDFQLKFRWWDIGIGAVGGVIGRIIANAIADAFVTPGGGGRSDQILGVTAQSAETWIVLIALTCVGAPFFEELFFRGLLQGALVGRIGPWIGIPITAVVFGSAHVFNAPGFSGVVYALAIMGGGLVLGVVYAIFGRLGASMATHACFNILAITALSFTIR